MNSGTYPCPEPATVEAELLQQWWGITRCLHAAGAKQGSRKESWFQSKKRASAGMSITHALAIFNCSTRGFSDIAIIEGLVVRVAMIKKPGLVSGPGEALQPGLRCPYQWNANTQQTISRDELLSFFDERLSFSYHKMQISPLMPVLSTLSHYDFPNSQNQRKELEKIPGKAAGLTKHIDQHVFNSLLPATWKGEPGKGCSMCTFLWTPDPCSDRFCLSAKMKCSHSYGVTPYGIDKYFYPLLIEGTFLIFMQRVAVVQPSFQFLGTKC